jgi:glycogen debranching enzyme
MTDAARLDDGRNHGNALPPDDRTRVLKHGETFGVFDRYGDVHFAHAGEQGLYHQGSRFLSYFQLRLNGQRPLLLNSSVKLDNFVLSVDLTTHDYFDEGKVTVLKGTVHVSRERLLWEAACHERLVVSNYGEQPVSLNLTLDFAADFADIFEARGFSRTRRGEYLTPQVDTTKAVLGYRGLDQVERRTGLSFQPAPKQLTSSQADFLVELGPLELQVIDFTVTCEPGAPSHDQVPHASVLAKADCSLRQMELGRCLVSTTNESFNDWITRSALDLGMLTLDNPEGPYPYAGVPWYSTPFGRDGLITAMHTLWVQPGMARSVLTYLAAAQANEVLPDQDAEPGKILHEVRRGELAAIGDIPFGRYYGSVDSTPLFVALAGQYLRRTGDIHFISTLWSNIRRALEWIDCYGDVDKDGFIEYQRNTAKGLANQGWKDSDNAVFHRDGQSAEGPIALCEVQAYVYSARLEAAAIADALGDKPHAQSLKQQAKELRDKFERYFWCESLGTYAMALDGNKRKCEIRASNAGHVLWGGIACDERAQTTGRTLLAPECFSGWGVRTLAEGEPRYNPMSYHNGSVWPHDNAMVAMGLARYGMKCGALDILDALFSASRFMDLQRLPELMCGFPKRRSEGPTLYPVACSPQAWASSSVFYLLQACLGLSLHYDAPHVRLHHPILPASIERMEIRNLQANDGFIDLALYRHEHDVGVNVLRKDSNIDISVLV